MSRADLEMKAYETIKADMSYIGTSDNEIWAEISNATDEEILNFLEEI